MNGREGSVNQPQDVASVPGNDDSRGRQSLQALEYSFPYHWLPERRDGACIPGRSMEWAHEYFRVLLRVQEIVQELRPHRVLDFGCGDGRLSHELVTTTDAVVVGIDMQEEAIQFARAFSLQYANRVQFVCDDVANLPERDFDVVVAMEVLEHIPVPEYDGVLQALSTRMVPGGRLVISVPTTNRPVQEKHERHFTASSLAESLDPWFTIESTEYVHSVGRLVASVTRLSTNRYFSILSRRLNAPITKLYQRLDRRTRASNGAHVIVVCERMSPAR